MRARDRRALVWGAAVMVTALATLRGIPAGVRAYRALEASAVEQAELLARARVTLAARGAVQDSFQSAARDLGALAPKALAEETPDEAAAELTHLVSLAAQGAGMRVVGVRATPDSSAGLFRPVTARAELEGDVAGLAEFLAALERAPEILSVRTLAVRAGDAQGRGRGAETLRVEATVAGWRIARAGS